MLHIDIVRFTIAVQGAALGLWDRVADRLDRTDERGEGVISAAIAVLIMAVIGAAMYVAYRALFNQTSASVTDKVNQISG